MALRKLNADALTRKKNQLKDDEDDGKDFLPPEP
jgi:hypothetical protein